MLTYKKSLGEKIAFSLILAAMWIVLIITLYPFVYVVSMSLSNPVNVISQSVWLFPKGFSLESYRIALSTPNLWISYYNTLFYTVVGTAINVALTILAAYPLSRGKFVLRGPIMTFIVFTMFFSGGLIPSFLLIKNLGLYDTRWAIVLSGAVSVFLIIVARTFLQGIPEGLHESAKIDGANDVSILFRIIIPLSMPIIAVLTLFYAVAHWNSYFIELIYLPSPKLQPLSLYLVKILIQNDSKTIGDMAGQYDRTLATAQLKFSVIIVAILPILAIYPFLQRYFVKGVMIGSLKG